MRFIEVIKSRKGKPLDLAGLGGKLVKACESFGINLFYVFGSYAKNDQAELSDLDLAYLADRKINELEFIPALQDIFEEEAIDLVDLRLAPPHLVHRILKEGKCLYRKKPGIKVDFETRAERIYWETRWLRERYFEKMLERLEDGTFGRR